MGVKSNDSGGFHHRSFAKMIIANKIEIYPKGLNTVTPRIAYDLCACGTNYSPYDYDIYEFLNYFLLR